MLVFYHSDYMSVCIIFRVFTVTTGKRNIMMVLV
jgi:hypothetical protein